MCKVPCVRNYLVRVNGTRCPAPLFQIIERGRDLRLIVMLHGLALGRFQRFQRRRKGNRREVCHQPYQTAGNSKNNEVGHQEPRQPISLEERYTKR